MYGIKFKLHLSMEAPGAKRMLKETIRSDGLYGVITCDTFATLPITFDLSLQTISKTNDEPTKLYEFILKVLTQTWVDRISDCEVNIVHQGLQQKTAKGILEWNETPKEKGTKKVSKSDDDVVYGKLEPVENDELGEKLQGFKHTWNKELLLEFEQKKEKNNPVIYPHFQKKTEPENTLFIKGSTLSSSSSSSRTSSSHSEKLGASASAVSNNSANLLEKKKKILKKELKLLKKDIELKREELKRDQEQFKRTRTVKERPRTV